MSHLRESLRSRPSNSKKRTYNYTSSQDYQQLMAPPPRQAAPSFTQHDFSFETKRAPAQTKQSSPERPYQPSPPRNNRRHVDEKISHIDSLNGKIASLLGSVKRESKQQEFSPSRPELPLSTPYRPEVSATTKRARLGEDTPVDGLYSAQRNRRANPVESEVKPYSRVDRSSVAPLQPSKQQATVVPEVQQSPGSLYHKPIDRSRVAQEYKEERRKRDETYKSELEARLEKQDKVISNNAELDARINQIRTKVIDQSPTKRKENQYPKPAPRVEVIGDTLRVKAENEVQRLAIKLSKVIEIDCTLRGVRESFANDHHSNKWEKLQTELKARNIYINEADLKKQIPLTPLERNPFEQVVATFPLNGAKDLAKLWGEAEWTWLQVQKSTSLEDLQACEFEFESMDLNRNGNVSIEDLTCFININAGKFYRSRDLVQLYRRLSQDENPIKGEGISYRGLRLKLCK